MRASDDGDRNYISFSQVERLLEQIQATLAPPIDAFAVKKPQEFVVIGAEGDTGVVEKTPYLIQTRSRCVRCIKPISSCQGPPCTYSCNDVTAEFIGNGWSG